MNGSKQWDAEWDITVEMARNLIYSQFPELAEKHVRKLGYGWDNSVFVVGDDYVFRFPRRKIAIDLLKIEGKILPMLQNYVSIPYPVPLFFGRENKDYPAPFIGYPYLTGDSPIGLTEEEHGLSTSLLASFLRRLHEFPVQVARDNGLPYDQRNLVNVALRKEKLLNYISDLAIHFNDKEYQDLSNYLHPLSTKRVKSKYVLLHGDLHFKNMLVDGTGRISGIIDWGDINIGHPACDLSVVYSYLPPEERPKFFQEYGEVDEETKIVARLMAVYIPVLIMMQALDEKDEQLIDEARATIKRAIAD